MPKKQRSKGSFVVGPKADRTKRDDALHKRYGRRPSLRQLYESRQVDLQAYEGAKRLRGEGRRDRPFQQLIATLRAERERQQLSLADVAQRAGIDRSAIHKLEIGLNKNPTCATLARYAEALGARIKRNLELEERGEAGRSKL
jgi:DNA-binding XRE family transcriptional regulator